MKQLIEDLISAMEYHVEQTRPIHSTTVALQAAREALRALAAPVQEPVGEVSGHDWSTGLLYRDLEPGTPLYTTPPAAPVPLTERELELIDGMIQVQLRHAEQCDGIANRSMAEKQKGWDMERVALLQKIKGNT